MRQYKSKAFHRHQYEVIAAKFRRMKEEERLSPAMMDGFDLAIAGLAVLFAEDNPDFNYARFMTAIEGVKV